MGGAYAQDPQGWKRPWWLWEVGLMLKEQKGPRRAPHPWPQRAGDLTWEPSRLPGLRQVGQMPSSPLLSCPSDLGGSLLPVSPDLPGLPPTPPRTHTAWRGLWRAGDQPGSSAGSLCPSGWGQSPSTPLLFLPEDPSCYVSCSPLGLLPMLPRTHETWRGALEGRGSAWELSRLPRPKWAR